MASLPPLTVANLAVTSTSAWSGLATANAGINLPGNKAINFGNDQTKATNAGNIGYQLATPGALDIYGAGTTVGSRNVQFWDNVTIPGTLSLSLRVPWTNISTLGYVGGAKDYGSGWQVGQYALDYFGWVVFRGLIVTGTATNTTLWTMPVGLRPPGTASTGLIIPAVVNASPASFQVFGNGQCSTPFGAAAGYMGLESFKYFATQ